jgi:hypothetical protein
MNIVVHFGRKGWYSLYETPGILCAEYTCYITCLHYFNTTIVRLKARHKPNNKVYLKYFNTTIVRLKVYLNPRMRGTDANFNTTIVRLKGY